MDKRPFCDCGGILIYSVDKILTNVEYKVNKNGQLAKRPSNNPLSVSLFSLEDYNLGRLSCEDCSNYYEVDYDKKMNIIRGELI